MNHSLSGVLRNKASIALTLLCIFSLRSFAVGDTTCAMEQTAVASWTARVQSDQDAVQQLRQAGTVDPQQTASLNATLQRDFQRLQQAKTRLAACQQHINAGTSAPTAAQHPSSPSAEKVVNAAEKTEDNAWNIQGLGKLRLGKPDLRTHKIGGTLTVETDQLDNIPPKTVMEMAGTLQGADLNIKGSTLTKGSYLDLTRETLAYEYALTIAARLDQGTPSTHLDGTASLVKSARYRNDKGATIRSFTISATRCSVISLTASSNRAFNSPQTFTAGQPAPFSPSVSKGPGAHLAIFFKDVATEGPAANPFIIRDFAVVVKAKLTCTPKPKGDWKLVSGTADLVVSQTDTDSVELRNLRKGGLYKITYDVHDGSRPSEANVVLPLAGAEVKERMLSDIRSANTYAESFDKNQNLFEQVTRLRFFQKIRNLASMGGGTYGNYRGRPDSAMDPTVWLYNGVSDSPSLRNPAGLGAVATWYGIPVRVSKLSNFIVGYTVQKIKVLPWIQQLAQNIGTPNDSSGDDSWKAGADLAAGRIKISDLKTIVIKLRRETQDNQKTVKLWPNLSPLGNFTDPQKFKDIDRQFTHPDFLAQPNQ